MRLRLVLALFVALAHGFCDTANISACTLLWANESLAWSTFYSDQPASATLGTPDYYPLFGTTSRSWSPSTPNAGAEFITLRYSQPIFIAAVSVYETWYPGALIRISVKRQDGRWTTLWSGDPGRLTSSRIFSPPLFCTLYGDTIQLDMDTSTWSTSYYEVDAVAVRGDAQNVTGLGLCPELNCSLSCLNGGTCLIEGFDMVCECVTPYIGPLCEYQVQYAGAALDVSSELFNNPAEEMTGFPDGYTWRYDVVNFPGEQFIEVLLDNPTFIQSMVIYGAGSPSLASIAVLTPGDTWTQIWQGIIPLNTTTATVNASCTPEFQAQNLRLFFTPSRIPNITSGIFGLDALQVIGANFSVTGMCVDTCPLFLNATDRCNTGRCESLLSTQAKCVCPLNTIGEFCSLLLQWVDRVTVATVGSRNLDYVTDRSDGYGMYYRTNSGPVSVTFAFQSAVYLSSYQFFFLDNTTAPALVRVLGRLNSSYSYTTLWDKFQGANWSKPLCQPQDPIQFLRMDFTLPPCAPDCIEIWIDAILLLGSLDREIARNNTLPTCSSLCTTSNPCLNAQPCVNQLNNATSCECSIAHGGPFCGDSLNFVGSILGSSYYPYKNPLTDYGLLDFPDIFPASNSNGRDCWQEGGCSNSWNFPLPQSDFIQFLDLKFIKSSFVTAIALYETAGPGVLTKVLLYNTDHWVQVWANQNGSGWLALSSSFTLGRETIPSWQCKPLFATDRVRLEFNTSLDGEIWNEWDAVRLFNLTEALIANITVPNANCTDNGCTPSFCTNTRAGTCASGPSGPYCVCSRDFSGDSCEFEERWPIASFATSDRYGTIATTLGPPDVYPLIYTPQPIKFWSPSFQSNIIILDYDLNQSWFVRSLDIFDANFGDTTMNLTSIAIGTPSILQEVWSGGIAIGLEYRTHVPVTNWSCITNISRLQFTFVETSSAYHRSLRLDTLGVISSSVSPGLPVCTFGTCVPNPCQNGGRCLFRGNNNDNNSSSNVRECVCANGYYGPMCESLGQWWATGVKDISAPYLSENVDIQTDHSAGNILGVPDVEKIGNDAGGFRFEPRDDQGVLLFEHIELTFPTPVYLSAMGVRILESLNAGCITRLLVRSNITSLPGEESQVPFMEVWKPKNTTNNSHPAGSVVEFQPLLDCIPDFPVQSLRIEVNTSMLPGWEEYDAVALIGTLIKPAISPSPPVCTSACTPSTCARGVCVTRVGGGVYCRCPSLWTGLRCELPSALQMRSFLRKQFAVISSTAPEVCFISRSGDIQCHGRLHRTHSAAPGRRYVQVTITSRYVCGLDNTGSAQCWFRDTGNSAWVSNVTLTSIATGMASVCGIKAEDSKIQCFICGSSFTNYCNMDFQTKFTDLSLGEELINCGLTYSGQAICFPYIGGDPVALKWSNNDPPTMPAIKQLDIGDSSTGGDNRCFLFVNGSVSCQRKGGRSWYFQLVNTPQAPWGLVVVGENNDVCGIYAKTGIVSCQEDANVTNLNIGPFSGQGGFLAMQADHLRGTRRARIMCAVDSRGSLKCSSTPTPGPTGIANLTLPPVANVTLPCDYLNGGCGEFMICTNLVGGAECNCPPGFETVNYPDLGYADCRDINECALHTLACPSFQYCLNLIGSAQCRDYVTPHVNHVVGCDPSLKINTYQPENCSTLGTQTITFCGSDIVAESVIVIGRGAGECSNVSYLPNNSTITVVGNKTVNCPQAFSCQVPEGRGATIELSMLRGGQAIDVGISYSYALPNLVSLGGCTTECSRTLLPRPVLELYGHDFGLSPVVLVGGASCPLLSNNHTSIRCTLPQGRGTQAVSVIAGGQISNFLSISYEPCLAGETDPTDQRNFTCEKCPKGFAKDAIGSSPCTLCATGKYASNMLGRGSVQCKDCSQQGLTCFNGLPQSADRYWGYSASNQFAVVYCPPNHCLANSVCVAGREQSPANVLCAKCEDGLLNWGNACVECKGFHWGLFLFMILLCELFCVFSHLMKRGSQKAGVTRLLVYFVQIALVMAGSSQLHVSFLNVVNFDLATASTAISNSCVFAITPEDQLVVLLLQPLIFLGVLLFNFGFRHATWGVCLSRGHKILRSWQKRPKVNGYFRSGLALLLFAYSSTCTKVFSFLRCQQVSPDGLAPVDVMFYYPTVSCEGEFYTNFRPLVIFVLVFYVLGFPIMSLCLLSYWKKKGLLEANKAGRWGVLYELYHTRVFFWQSVELLLRFIFALIDSQFSSNYLVRASLFSFVNLTALLAQIVSHPYIDAQVNKLESIVHSILLCLAFLLSTDATGNVPEGASWVFFAFVLSVIILLIGIMAYHKTRMLHEFYTHRGRFAKGETALHRDTAELTTKQLEAHPDPTN